jgi:uncharacterized protein
LIKISLLPRDRKFSLLFQQGADNIARMAREFKELVYSWDDVKVRVSLLADMERDGDAINHDIMALLHRSFITPFDREDIGVLAKSIDDVADLIYSTANTMSLYSVAGASDRAKEMTELISQTAAAIQRAIAGISGHINQAQLLRECVEINRLENMGDELYGHALAELFAQSNDVIHIIKWREIYRDMEATIDAAEAIADVLEAVALKYA